MARRGCPRRASHAPGRNDMKTSDLLNCLIEIERDGHPTEDGAVWLVTGEAPHRAHPCIRLHCNDHGRRWVYLLDIDGGDVTVSFYDDEGREVILTGEIVDRPTVTHDYSDRQELAEASHALGDRLCSEAMAAIDVR